MVIIQWTNQFKCCIGHIDTDYINTVITALCRDFYFLSWQTFAVGNCRLVANGGRKCGINSVNVTSWRDWLALVDSTVLFGECDGSVISFKYKSRERRFYHKMLKIQYTILITRSVLARVCYIVCVGIEWYSLREKSFCTCYLLYDNKRKNI